MWPARARPGALALALVVIFGLQLVCCSIVSTNEEFSIPQEGLVLPQQQQHQHFPPPRVRLMQSMLDFDTYKRLFHKTYSSLVEELARQKYYLARAFRAFASGIKYKYRSLSYFLRVNDMSDLNIVELDQMDNKVLEMSDYATSEVTSPLNATNNLLPQFNWLDEERLVDVEADIEQFIESDSDVRRELVTAATRRRHKRDLSGGGAATTTTTTSQEPLVSVGPYEEMDFYNTRKRISMKSRLSDDDSDVIYFDHRDSGCLFEPRRQGKCGGCYAFSMIAYMEWLVCKQSGQLLAFSEQYLIDCGRNRVGNLDGCQGGGHFSIGEFVLNFGLELRTNYPYRMREDHCPYDAEMKVKLATTGQMRFERPNGLELGSMVPMSAWPEYLQYAPMIVSLITRQTSFNEYGGGVYDGTGCAPGAPSNHMMLLVGHGREEGVEYWLIRNSYSIGWGEEGYYKLAKLSDCIRPAKGFMYGTRDGGKSFVGKASENKLNDRSFVRRHYAANMAADLAKWEV